MSCPTEIRDSATRITPRSGTTWSNLRQVFTDKSGRLFYIEPGKPGERSAIRRPAHDLDAEYPLAVLPHNKIPLEILPQASAKLVRGDTIILYRKKESNN